MPRRRRMKRCKHGVRTCRQLRGHRHDDLFAQFALDADSRSQVELRQRTARLFAYYMPWHIILKPLWPRNMRLDGGPALARMLQVLQNALLFSAFCRIIVRRGWLGTEASMDVGVQRRSRLTAIDMLLHMFTLQVISARSAWARTEMRQVSNAHPVAELC